MGSLRGLVGPDRQATSVPADASEAPVTAPGLATTFLTPRLLADGILTATTSQGPRRVSRRAASLLLNEAVGPALIPYLEQPALALGRSRYTPSAFSSRAPSSLARRSFGAGPRHRGSADATVGRFLAWVLLGGFAGAHLVDRLIYFPGGDHR